MTNEDISYHVGTLTASWCDGQHHSLARFTLHYITWELLSVR